LLAVTVVRSQEVSPADENSAAITVRSAAPPPPMDHRVPDLRAATLGSRLMRFRSAPSARSSSSSSNRPRDAVISAIAGGARIERTTLRAGISSAARMRTTAARGTLKPNAGVPDGAYAILQSFGSLSNWRALSLPEKPAAASPQKRAAPLWYLLLKQAQLFGIVQSDNPHAMAYPL
jgi:hypothetical protein